MSNLDAAQVRELIAEARKRYEAATPGPWDGGAGTYRHADGAPYVKCYMIGVRDRVVAVTPSREPDEEANAEFIVAARTDVPALCDALESALSVMERVSEIERNCRAVAGQNPHPYGPRYVQACTEAADALRRALTGESA